MKERFEFWRERFEWIGGVAILDEGTREVAREVAREAAKLRRRIKEEDSARG